jgi:hypothetical protein
VPETTTAPATTVLTTETVQQTTTRKVIVPTAGTTTSSSTENSSTPTWVWVVLALLGVAVIGLIVALVTRRGGVSPAERRRRLDQGVSTWAAQGWALQSQTGDSAVLQRGGELMLVSVDEAGQVSARPLPRST